MQTCRYIAIRSCSIRKQAFLYVFVHVPSSYRRRAPLFPRCSLISNIIRLSPYQFRCSSLLFAVFDDFEGERRQRRYSQIETGEPFGSPVFIRAVLSKSNPNVPQKSKHNVSGGHLFYHPFFSQIILFPPHFLLHFLSLIRGFPPHFLPHSPIHSLPLPSRGPIGKQRRKPIMPFSLPIPIDMTWAAVAAPHPLPCPFQFL